MKGNQCFFFKSCCFQRDLYQTNSGNAIQSGRPVFLQVSCGSLEKRMELRCGFFLGHIERLQVNLNGLTIAGKVFGIPRLEGDANNAGQKENNHDDR